MAVPDPPSSLVATADYLSVDLAWSATDTPDATYDVYAGTVAGMEYLDAQMLYGAYATCAILAADVATCADLIPTAVNAAPITAETYTVTGLTDGTPYYFRVVAVLAGTPSTPSNQASATPAPQPPTPPQDVTAEAGDASATVDWLAPASTNGSALTGYTVTSSRGDVVSVGPSTLIAHFVGLTNWSPYTFTVTATNGVGTSANSAPSNQITPEGMPGRPTVTAVSEPDPVSGLPIIAITITADVTSADSDATVTATVMRSDGTYVLGASPLYPYVLSVDSPTFTIYDRTAPYAQYVSYTSNISFASTGPPYTTPPSIPSTPVQMGQAPDTTDLWCRMGFAAEEDLSGQLLMWLSGIGQMVQAIDSLAKDSYDLDLLAASGWSQVLDITRCPTAALPWLGQFVGVSVNSTLRDDQQRWQIAHPTGWARGTLGSIESAVNQYLAPGFTVTVNERDTSPYHLTIVVPTDGFVGNVTCLAISQRYPTCLALENAYATCAEVWNRTASGSPSGASTCQVIADTYATCALFEAAFATCAAVWEVDYFIAEAVAATVPAGINVTVTYS